jgi:hypothetical protein
MRGRTQADNLRPKCHKSVVAIVSDMVECNMNGHDGLHNRMRGSHCIEVRQVKKAAINAEQLCRRCKLGYGNMQALKAKAEGPALLYAN